MFNKLANDVTVRVMEKLGNSTGEFVQDAISNLQHAFKERYMPEPDIISKTFGLKDDSIGLSNAVHDILSVGGIAGGAELAHNLASAKGVKVNGKDLKMSLGDKAKILGGALLGGTAGHYMGEAGGDLIGQGVTDAAFSIPHDVTRDNIELLVGLRNFVPRASEGMGEQMGTLIGAGAGAVPGMVSRIKKEIAPLEPKIKEYAKAHPGASGEEISKALGII